MAIYQRGNAGEISMRLIRITDFADRYFDETCRPDQRVVRLWCEKGLLPARRIGKPWYIDADLFEQTHDGALLDRIRIGGANSGAKATKEKQRSPAISVPVS